MPWSSGRSSFCLPLHSYSHDQVVVMMMILMITLMMLVVMVIMTMMMMMKMTMMMVMTVRLNGHFIFRAKMDDPLDAVAVHGGGGFHFIQIWWLITWFDFMIWFHDLISWFHDFISWYSWYSPRRRRFSIHFTQIYFWRLFGCLFTFWSFYSMSTDISAESEDLHKINNVWNIYLKVLNFPRFHAKVSFFQR